MIKKILVKGPSLSRSGYGEQTRFALRSLRSREDIFDIYLIDIPWGATSNIFMNSEDHAWIVALMNKTIQYVQQGGQFDISLQITIPPEWEKIAPINIGYTAGIETTKVAPSWVAKANEMDKIIVISNHSKNTYQQTVVEAVNEATQEKTLIHCETPMTVVNYPVRTHETEELEDLELDYDFNFLTVAQSSPRKNLQNTIQWFIEEFKDDEVGLIVKTNLAKDSVVDRGYAAAALEGLMQSYPDRKCKIYLLHGTLSEGNLKWLYTHDKIKSLISLSHGEGFGLPMFEAAWNGLPLITTSWSGQTDFIKAPNKSGKSKPHIAKVEHDLRPVQPEAVWEGVIEADSMWAFPREQSYKRALRSMYKTHPRFKSMAKKLQKHILKNFNEEKIFNDFVSAIIPSEEMEWIKQLGAIEIL